MPRADPAAPAVSERTEQCQKVLAEFNSAVKEITEEEKQKGLNPRTRREIATELSVQLFDTVLAYTSFSTFDNIYVLYQFLNDQIDLKKGI